jgi:electron transfer flavoprotein alpha subunit
VLSSESSANRGTLAAALAPQIVAMADGYDYIFGPSTTFGKDLMPRVAALLGVNQVSDLMSVEGEPQISRITPAISEARPVSPTGRICNRLRALWPEDELSAARKIST